MFLICKLGPNGEVKSPGVGRAKLYMKINQTVSQGQIIGDFFQLNKTYKLKLADDFSGKIISIKDSDKIINLSFNEVFLVIDKNNASEKNNIASKETHDLSINSPMDGMFYLSASPKDPPFIKIGDEINHGHTLGLIEVMKCFYPLKYQGHDKAKIVKINIANASPVTSGTKIYSIVIV